MSWSDNVHAKAAILHQQIGGMMALARHHDQDPNAAIRPYLLELQALYERELPFAHVLDTSDIVFRMNGPDVDREAPIIRAVANAFNDIREQIGKVAKAIIGLSEQEGAKLVGPELALSGIAKGSLVVGVKIATQDRPQVGETATIFGEQDPLTLAVRQAVRQIAVVTRYLSEEGVDPMIAEAIPDPALRDTVVVAAHQLAPSGRGGINKVSIFTADIDNGHALTPRVRRAVASTVNKPVLSKETGEFVGIIREMDLDAKRFEVRGVKGAGAVRCLYPEGYREAARDWLDRPVRVSGLIERLNGKPRLMQVERIEVLTVPTSGKLFPDS